jgi:hypothetical protein
LHHVGMALVMRADLLQVQGHGSKSRQGVGRALLAVCCMRLLSVARAGTIDCCMWGPCPRARYPPPGAARHHEPAGHACISVRCVCAALNNGHYFAPPPSGDEMRLRINPDRVVQLSHSACRSRCVGCTDHRRTRTISKSAPARIQHPPDSSAGCSSSAGESEVRYSGRGGGEYITLSACQSVRLHRRED